MRLVLLAVPPSTNNLYAVVRGRQVLTQAGRLFHAATESAARRTWTRLPSDRPFAVLVTYHLGGYDRDVDGSHKALLDGMSGVIWNDDRQVVLFAARKRRVPKGVLPYVSVIIRELAAAPAWRGEPPVPSRALGWATTIMPPSTNNTYTTFRGVRRKSVEAKQVTAAYAGGFAQLAGPDRPRHPDAALRLRLRYAITADRRDVDGSHKLMLDAARGVLWSDDLQIASFSVAKARLGHHTDTPLIAGALWTVSPVERPAATKLARAA